MKRNMHHIGFDIFVVNKGVDLVVYIKGAQSMVSLRNPCNGTLWIKCKFMAPRPPFGWQKHFQQPMVLEETQAT